MKLKKNRILTSCGGILKNRSIFMLDTLKSKRRNFEKKFVTFSLSRHFKIEKYLYFDFQIAKYQKQLSFYAKRIEMQTISKLLGKNSLECEKQYFIVASV